MLYIYELHPLIAFNKPATNSSPNQYKISCLPFSWQTSIFFSTDHHSDYRKMFIMVVLEGVLSVIMIVIGTILCYFQVFFGVIDGWKVQIQHILYIIVFSIHLYGGNHNFEGQISKT